MNNLPERYEPSPSPVPFGPAARLARQQRQADRQLATYAVDRYVAVAKAEVDQLANSRAVQSAIQSELEVARWVLAAAGNSATAQEIVAVNLQRLMNLDGDSMRRHLGR